MAKKRKMDSGIVMSERDREELDRSNALDAVAQGKGDRGTYIPGETIGDVRAGDRMMGRERSEPAIGQALSPGNATGFRGGRAMVDAQGRGVFTGGSPDRRDDNVAATRYTRAERNYMAHDRDTTRARDYIESSGLPVYLDDAPRTGIQPSAGPQRKIIQGAYGTMPNGRKVFYDPRTGRRRPEKQVAQATQDSGADIAGEIGTNPAQVNASQIDYLGLPMSPNPSYRGTSQPAQPQGIMPSTGGGTEPAPTTADDGAVYGPGNVSGIRRARQEAFTAKTRENAARFGLIPGEGGLGGAMARYNRLKNTTQGRGLVNPEAIAAAERAQALASKRDGLTVMQEITMQLRAAEHALKLAQASGTDQYRRSQLEMDQAKLRDAQQARGELRTREDAQRREDMTREDRDAERKIIGDEIAKLGIAGVFATDADAREIVTDDSVREASDALKAAKSKYEDLQRVSKDKDELETARQEVIDKKDALGMAVKSVRMRPRVEAAPVGPTRTARGAMPAVERHLVRRLEAPPSGIQPSAVPQAVVAPAAPAAPSAPTDNPQRAAALQWLKDNPNDPRAPAIRKKLGMQ